MSGFESIVSGTDQPTTYPAVVLVNSDDPTDNVRAFGYRIDPDGTVAGLPEAPADYAPEFVNTAVLGWVAADWGVDPMTALGQVAAVPSGVDGVVLLTFGHGGDSDGDSLPNPTAEAVIRALFPADTIVDGATLHGPVFILSGGQATGESTTAPFAPFPQSVADTIAEITGADVTRAAGDGSREVDTDAGFSLCTMLGITPYGVNGPDAIDRDASPQTIADVLAMLGITDGAVDGSDVDDSDDSDDDSDDNDDDGFGEFLASLLGSPEGPALGDDVYPDMVDADGPFVPDLTDDDGDPFGFLADADADADSDAPVIVWAVDADHPGQGADPRS